MVFHGREIYAWHPDGVARSKLWNALAGKGLGVTATARNWTTVTDAAGDGRRLSVPADVSLGIGERQRPAGESELVGRCRPGEGVVAV